ncbi:MAG TPA: NUDIX domain-containing protein [Ignavibacteria bacterium]
MLSSEYQKVAGIIIFIRKKNKDKFLILKNNKNKWDFPKGKVDRSESILKASLRELYEETGIDNINIIDGFFEKIRYQDNKKSGKTTKKLAYFYLAKSNISKVVLSDEHSNYKWFEYKKALSTLSYKSSKELLKYAVIYLKKIK